MRKAVQPERTVSSSRFLSRAPVRTAICCLRRPEEYLLECLLMCKHFIKVNGIYLCVTSTPWNKRVHCYIEPDLPSVHMCNTYNRLLRHPRNDWISTDSILDLVKILLHSSPTLVALPSFKPSRLSCCWPFPSIYTLIAPKQRQSEQHILKVLDSAIHQQFKAGLMSRFS